MLSNQPALPRWPLPALEETLARYLEAVRHIVPAADHAATELLVKGALQDGSSMRKLHAALARDDESRTAQSFVSEQWDRMYFEGREGIAVHSTPGIRLRTDAFPPAARSQVHRAARMLAATLAFATEVESRSLTPDTFRKTPLDMQQYMRMFSSCRLPKPDLDARHQAAAPAGHVVVLRGAEFWSVPVTDVATGRPSAWPASSASCSTSSTTRHHGRHRTRLLRSPCSRRRRVRGGVPRGPRCSANRRATCARCARSTRL